MSEIVRSFRAPAAPRQTKRAGAVNLDFEMLYAVLFRRAERVVKRIGWIASTSARERAPVRKIFTGGRRTAPRFYSLSEAKNELPAFLSTEPRHPSGRRMSAGQALNQLRQTPIATSRNRANSYQRTSLVNWRSRQARDDLGNVRRGFLDDGTPRALYAAMRDIEIQKGENRLFDRSAEKRLTTRGRWELKSGRARSFSQNLRAEEERYGRLKTEAERVSARRALDVRDEHGRLISPPGSEGQIGGNLRRSIHVEDRTTGDKVKTSVVAGGEDAPYARFVEFGTRHAAAQPFLRPALKHVEGPFKSEMRAAYPGAK